MLPGLAAFIILAAICASPAHADGGLMIYDPNAQLWRLQEMNNQLCVINHDKGEERLLLSIHTDALQGERAVWIFPVPAKPDGVTIDVFKSFPILKGHNVERLSGSVIDGVFSYMRLTQIYSFPFAGKYLPVFLGHYRVMARLGDFEGVDVHQRLEKMGLTTELITARDGTRLADYLTAKDLTLPPDIKSVFDEYLGQEYSFVISWISDVEKFNQEAKKVTEYQYRYGGHDQGNAFYSLSVSISFPSEKIYFPMRLTSVYGDTVIPMTVYVTKYVAPEISLGKSLRVSYLINNSRYDVPEELKSFFNGKTSLKNQGYTEISINAPSRLLTEDLWMTEKVPAKIAFADFIFRYFWAWGVAVFILLSCLSSWLAGMVAFRKYQPSKVRFALFGLYNFFTLIGFTIAAHRLKIDDRLTRKTEAPQPKVSFRSAAKVSAAISAVMDVSILGFMIFSTGTRFHPGHLLFLAVAFLIFFLALFPFVYVFMNNRHVRNYVLLFTAFFMVMSILAQAGLKAYSWILLGVNYGP
ncbi:MAG: hypothetical protein Q8Q08_04410 [Candidatus Omnitrophota bacterium]|nr:hypothetical protein [Candidatus Omnitrophota bacterium]